MTEVGRPPTGRCRRLTLAYDGAAYAGWQVQPDARTVQGTLQDALGSMLGEPVRVCGAGRTDAGVHALGQVAHFHDPKGLPLERLRGALNGVLPADVRIVDLAAAPDDFHALHSARAKTYFYQLHLSDESGGVRAVEASVPPHRRRTFHAVRGDLDLRAMRRGARHLVGTHDFTTLSKAMPAGRSTVKHVRAVRILRVSHGLRLFVTGDGFLYGMVRLVAGLLVDIGRGRLPPDAVPALLEAADRSRAAASLPAHALFLWSVDYGD